MLLWCLLRLELWWYSQGTWTWGTGMWHIIFSPRCTWVCSCSCYLQSMALFMPLPPVLSRALVLSHPPLIAKCQGELSVAAVFPGHSRPVLALKLHFSVPLNKFSSLFAVMTLQLIMRRLPVNLALLCPLRLSCHSHVLTAFYLTLKMAFQNTGEEKERKWNNYTFPS